MLRASRARDGGQVLAPGDREWAEAERREREGVPLDPVTTRNFRELAARFGLEAPFSMDGREQEKRASGA